MKLLLDEDVHVQLVEPLRRLLREHQVDSRSRVEGEEGIASCFPMPVETAMTPYSRTTALSSTAPRRTGPRPPPLPREPVPYATSRNRADLDDNELFAPRS